MNRTRTDPDPVHKQSTMRRNADRSLACLHKSRDSPDRATSSVPSHGRCPGAACHPCRDAREYKGGGAGRLFISQARLALAFLPFPHFSCSLTPSRHHAHRPPTTPCSAFRSLHSLLRSSHLARSPSHSLVPTIGTLPAHPELVATLLVMVNDARSARFLWYASHFFTRKS